MEQNCSGSVRYVVEENCSDSVRYIAEENCLGSVQFGKILKIFVRVRLFTEPNSAEH